MSENLTPQEIMSYVTEVASAYLVNNEMPQEEMSGFLRKVYQAVIELCKDANNIRHRPALTPAVPVEESVNDDYIVCLEDGKKLQMLKRHLDTVYNMTIEQYKERWGLPLDYPVVSPNYAKRRSEIAKTTGLGSTGRKKVVREQAA
ncbi:MAG: MucR family transcriptional regulator [Holosporales bacterium]|jgi:predicted transcriptional regulator|nr:MucR family transcriptional regulator [Holosporales bacterium]